MKSTADILQRILRRARPWESRACHAMYVSKLISLPNYDAPGFGVRHPSAGQPSRSWQRGRERAQVAALRCQNRAIVCRNDLSLLGRIPPEGVESKPPTNPDTHLR